MPLFTRILAPVDFSDASRAAACYAGALAARTGARLSLLHAVQPMPAAFDYSMVGPSDQVLRELSESLEARALQQLERLEVPGDDIRRTLSDGDPATEILRAAESDRADLIVMSTHGAAGLQRVFGVGSVTLRVLGGATCPVLTGLDFSAPPPVTGGTIVCALDLGPSAPRTLQWAGRAARELGARLTVVHATTLADKKQAGLIDDGWHEVLARRLTLHFQQLLTSGGHDAEIVIDDGSVHQVVAKTASETNAGWVVIGRSATLGVADRLRANTYDIVRHAPCPVVSV